MKTEPWIPHPLSIPRTGVIADGALWEIRAGLDVELEAGLVVESSEL